MAVNLQRFTFHLNAQDQVVDVDTPSASSIMIENTLRISALLSPDVVENFAKKLPIQLRMHRRLGSVTAYIVLVYEPLNIAEGAELFTQLLAEHQAAYEQR